MYKQIQAQWLVVAERVDASGNTCTELRVIDGPVLPWRISKRQTWGYRHGLSYVQSLPNRKPWDREGIAALSVSDGKRALASWKHMDKLGGYTGTHDVHPLISEHLKGR